MRLAVSNIAWDPAENDAVAEVLAREGAAGVEIAPTKWREDALTAPLRDVAELRMYWEDRGLGIASLQSLLWGRPDLQLFSDKASRSALTDLLKRAIDLAGALGAAALVFGSPKNRVRGDLPLADAMRIATDVLRELGEHARPHDTAFCVEANPAGYGCDFITTTAEAVELCRRVDHPNVRVNADLGGMAMAEEDPKTEIIAAGSRIGHVHASEPHLAELANSSVHRKAAEGLRTIGYDRWVSIEMRAADQGHLAAIQRAVRIAKARYQ